MSANRRYRIAVIPGDGIGKEVMPEGIRALETAASRFGFEIEQQWQDFANCDYYAAHGQMMPDDWKERIGKPDAIFFGAVGWPDTVPDHISLWQSILQFRREYDQYVNLRPVRLMPGVPSPLAGREPGDIDFWVVRENTEGEYSSIGGHVFPGTEREIVIQETVMTRFGIDRVLRFAFDLASKRPRRHVTSATKSNGIAITMPFWDGRVEAIAAEYPDVTHDKYHIDILTAQFVMNPQRFDVVVASNLFGDILSDRRALGQSQPGRHAPLTVRAGPRLGPGHRRQRDCQSGRPGLVGGDDARIPRRRGSGGRDDGVRGGRTLQRHGANRRSRGQRRHGGLRKGHRCEHLRSGRLCRPHGRA